MSEHSDREGSHSPELEQLDTAMTTEVQTSNRDPEVGTSASGQVPHPEITVISEDHSLFTASGQSNRNQISDQTDRVAIDEIEKYKGLLSKAVDQIKRQEAHQAQTNRLMQQMNSEINSLKTKITVQNGNTSEKELPESRPHTASDKDTRSETGSDLSAGFAKLVEVLTKQNSQESAARPIKQTPPAYYGDQTNANDWLKTYKLTSKANEWTSKQMANYLISVMKDSARDWFMAKFPEGCEDFKKFEEVFMQERIPASYIADIRAKLYSVEYEPSETTTAFLDKLLNIGVQCSPPATEQEIIGCFRKGIQAKVRNSTLTVKTIADLRAALQNWEDRKPKQEPQPQYPRPSVNAGGPPPPALKPPMVRPQVQANRLPPLRLAPVDQKVEENPRRMGKCHNCLEFGHHVAACPMPKNQDRINESIKQLAEKRIQTKPSRQSKCR